MIKIDLITGFLGSGKTTFIKKYAKYLMQQGHKVGILENDFGAVNVDMLMLNELRGEQCELEMVAGGCDIDCHKRRFKTKLISMGMCGYTRVLVEPSGIFDVDEFFDVLHEEPLDEWYEIGNVIGIVDAALPENLSDASDYLLASELSSAGTVLISKVALANREQIENTKKHMQRALKKVKCDRIFQNEIIEKDWEDFTEDDFSKIANCGYKMTSFEKKSMEQDEVYHSLYVFNQNPTRNQFELAAKKVLQDAKFGNVLRVKGFIHSPDGEWLECNCTKEQFLMREVEVGQEVILVIGEALNNELIEKEFIFEV